MKKFVIFTICLLLIFQCLIWALLSGSKSNTLSLFEKDDEEIVIPDLLYRTDIETEGNYITKLYTELKFQFDKSNLNPNYRDNQEALNHFEFLLDSIGADNIENLEIVIQSSPEGVFEHNVNLTRKRARSIMDFLSEKYPMLAGKVVITRVGESWALLLEYVKDDTKLSDKSKEKIIGVIESDINLGTKKWRMENTLGKDPAVGDVYRYLLSKYYPLIRLSGFYISLNPLPEMSDDDFCGLIRPAITLPDSIFIREISNESDSEIEDTEDDTEIEASEIDEIDDTDDTEDIVFEPTNENVAVVALKTNLLFDVVSALNAEIEIPIGRHLSVSVSDVFPWWEKDNKYCFEILAVGPELRYYLKAAEDRDKKLRGLFVGAYAFSGKYDLQNDRRLGYQGRGWSTGLSYGYSTPIGNRELFNLEMSMSLGLAKIKYQHYYPSTNYDRLVRDPNKAGRMTYFGPTGLKVSLVKPVVIQMRHR